MKSRLISAGIGLIVLFSILFFYQTYVFNVAVGLIGAMAVYEILNSTKMVQFKPLIFCGVAFALVVPFLSIKSNGMLLALALFTLALFVTFLSNHNKVRFENIAVVFMASLLIPFSLTSVVFMRNQEKQLAMYYIIIMFALAWISDAGAYFVGRALGKHKLAPVVSPKKTVEGAIGGVLICVIFNVLYTLGYTFVMKDLGTIDVNYLALVLVSLVGAVTGIFGDLSASIIKRQTQIKDFGNIMPGHGGVLDRFDSVLFVAPFLFIILQFVKIIEIV